MEPFPSPINDQMVLDFSSQIALVFIFFLPVSAILTYRNLCGLISRLLGDLSFSSRPFQAFLMPIHPAYQYSLNAIFVMSLSSHTFHGVLLPTRSEKSKVLQDEKIRNDLVQHFLFVEKK